jgi:hypothetical protein
LADLTARLIDDPAIATEQRPQLTARFSHPGRLAIGPQLVHHSYIGNLRFLKPILELDTHQVTSAEAQAYERWRTMYQRNWRWAFDPIGLRVTWTPDQVAGDLTVIPLIARTDYQPLVDVSRGAALKPTDGDPHGAPLHVALALNKQSGWFNLASGLARSAAPGLRIDPLAWLGDSVAFYADRDPLWQELAEYPASELQQRWQDFGPRLPIALHAEVSDGLRLGAFLVAVRAWMEQTIPGMLLWETLEHRETPYVRITPTERAIGEQQGLRNFSLYYYASGQSLTITPHRGVLERAIDRDLAKQETAEPPGVEGQAAWLGSNLAIHTDPMWIGVWRQIQTAELRRRMQRHAWQHLPALNEWHRLFPDTDPSDVAHRYWHQRPICPGGGQYVWNETWQTMESTVYGHPAQPKSGPPLPLHLQRMLEADFGLTLEPQGLRARVQLQMQP